MALNIELDKPGERHGLSNQVRRLRVIIGGAHQFRLRLRTAAEPLRRAK